MAEVGSRRYPSNKAYVEDAQSEPVSSPRNDNKIEPLDSPNFSPSAMSASALVERVQYL